MARASEAVRKSSFKSKDDLGDIVIQEMKRKSMATDAGGNNNADKSIDLDDERLSDAKEIGRKQSEEVMRRKKSRLCTLL